MLSLHLKVGGVKKEEEEMEGDAPKSESEDPAAPQWVLWVKSPSVNQGPESCAL